MTFKYKRMRNSITSKSNAWIPQQLQSEKISNCMIFFGKYKVSSIWFFAVRPVDQTLLIILIFPSPSKKFFWCISHFYSNWIELVAKVQKFLGFALRCPVLGLGLGGWSGENVHRLRT